MHKKHKLVLDILCVTQANVVSWPIIVKDD